VAQLDINGTRLEIFEQGVGDPVVLVHGSASDLRTWHGPQRELAKRYRTIAYSRRYHWPNEPIPEQADYAMHEHVDDLRALLGRLQTGPAHLVGNSYGGFVCLLLALREPQLARTLVLTEPPVLTLFTSSQPRPTEILRLLLTRPRTAAAIVKLGAAGIGPATSAARRGDMDTAMRVFGSAVLGPEFYHRLSTRRLEQVRANAFKAEFLGSGFPPLDGEDLRKLETPVLLINGGRSPKLFHRLNDGLERLLPRCERIEIEGASHIVHEDNAQAFTAATLAFLEKH